MNEKERPESERFLRLLLGNLSHVKGMRCEVSGDRVFIDLTVDARLRNLVLDFIRGFPPDRVYLSLPKPKRREK